MIERKVAQIVADLTKISIPFLFLDNSIVATQKNKNNIKIFDNSKTASPIFAALVRDNIEKNK